MQEYKSKSQKKREAEAMTQLGLSLTKLPLAQLKLIPLPEPIRQAVLEAKAIKSHTAKKRQIHYIGGLLRDLDDVSAIQTTYNNLLQGVAADTAQFHLIEQWRDRLMSADNKALTEFIAQYPHADSQQLRQLLRKAIHEREQQKNQGAAKALFQLLKSIIA